MIHLVAEVKAYPDSKDQVVNLLAGLLEPTRQEEGCCQYELYLDEKVDGLFIFQEIWASQEALDTHLQSPHMATFLETLEENDWVEYTQIRPLRFIA
ncbi:putative quinol monooxygenase [Vibrio parahaemolyticus]|uniref:putative quinol monooxygenase n=1 Tax=Vibrio parahaemolyticus TaxID=670 RepID=UPI0004D452C2|nr:putative quinol monooxygenase [Vibrio parahaemolyticus]EJG0618636.1 antibiotic biosynthesis monooxygenase [Vibrio parahaemolyticus]EJG0636858.1 antibiotic biosynthesis monooxygenase [Vibrio parahaemolyticus]EJG0683340.1 antibiotic biosynthesis monooxygenase [Vibrio parahaemolyticus]EJG0698419.1 antibiotic biosynthesis monooxygenase [Vibrio parahaemolyticus]EJG0727550.1 antibiotic biosynthesis monooxygenase [Vibrio parahaemolyticus]